jgi:hypothetical protein
MAVLAQRKVRERANVGVVVDDQNTAAAQEFAARARSRRRAGQVLDAVRRDGEIEPLVRTADVDNVTQLLACSRARFSRLSTKGSS